MNERDSEAIKSLLKLSNYNIVENEENADIVILNTCSVRRLAELKAIGKAGHLLKNKRKNSNYIVGIVGCMAENLGPDLFKSLPALDFIAGPRELQQIPDFLEKIQQNKFNKTLFEKNDKFNFNCYEKNLFPKVSAFIPIQQGCSMKCSYCIVPKTRGEQENRPFDSILKEINCAVQNGTKEIMLLGQIVNAYKYQNKTFADLLTEINKIHNLQRIRFMSPHPAFFRKDLIDCFKNLEKLCPAVHLPMQSGSNNILKAMKRGYSAEKILSIIAELKNIAPDMSFSTDVIVGYPNETDHDFEQTYNVFDQIGFDMAYIFKYSERPNTPAANNFSQSQQVPEAVKEKRNEILLNLLSKHSYNYNKKWLNSTLNVLVEGNTTRGNKKLFGHTIHNKKVFFAGCQKLIGSTINVKITKITNSSLFGEL